MVKRTRFTLCLLVTAATFTATAPLAGAEELAVAATTTICNGGDTDPFASKLPGGQDIYLSWEDASLWHNDNAVPGIQKTAKDCVVTDANHRVISAYQEYPADEEVA